MKKVLLLFNLLASFHTCFCWGFFSHQKINYYAVFLLPPQMMVFYKPNLAFLSEHAVDPDKRRYAVWEEGPRHFMDIDHYGTYPFDSLPRRWDEAIAKYTQDTLEQHGIVPWWVVVMQRRLTTAFKEKDGARILKLSADLGHYIADAHVPLHVSSNHNGQLTNQVGIHAFWESRIPELLAEREWNFIIGKAEYIKNPADFIWKRVLESAAAADTVLKYEQVLSARFAPDRKFAFEDRNGSTIRQYSSAYCIDYNNSLKGMIERRMRLSIYAVASFWYTAWVDAGQPDLKTLTNKTFSEEDQKELDAINREWKRGVIKGREEYN